MELSGPSGICEAITQKVRVGGQSMISRHHGDSSLSFRGQFGGADDGLGPNSDIGAKLRALYGSVQDEGIPPKLLDLLEKLDQAELQQAQRAPRGE